MIPNVRPRRAMRVLAALALVLLGMLVAPTADAAPATPTIAAPVTTPDATLDAQRSTLNAQRSTLNAQRSTPDAQRSTPAVDAGPVAQAIADAMVPDAALPGATPPASGAGTALQVLVLMTVLSLLPAIALTMTCFTRIIIVFSFLRQALGLPGAPPNQVLTGMALFITAFVMTPTVSKVYEQSIVPLQQQQIGAVEALDRASKPMVEFMLKHTSDEDLRLFYEVADRPRPDSREDASLFVVVPAFTLSEVRTAFTMGFLILVPFLVIDLVVSSVLMAMGMVMLPPALVTLPLKVLVFVLADGWGLVIGSLVRSLTS